MSSSTSLHAPACPVCVALDSCKAQLGVARRMFATAPSPKGPWRVLDISRYSMPVNVEHADPTLRFIPDTEPASELGGKQRESGSEHGTFYCLTGRASLSTPCSDSVGRYFMEIYRSRDLISWEPSAGMGTPSLISGMLEPNATLDRRPALPRYSSAEHGCKHGHALCSTTPPTCGCPQTWRRTRTRRTRGPTATQATWISASSMGRRGYSGPGAIRAKMVGLCWGSRRCHSLISSPRGSDPASTSQLAPQDYAVGRGMHAETEVECIQTPWSLNDTFNSFNSPSAMHPGHKHLRFPWELSRLGPPSRAMSPPPLHPLPTHCR